MRDSLASRGQVNYSDLTDAEVSDLKVLVSSFLEGSASVEQLPSQTLKQVKETYRQMQLAYQASKSSQVSRCIMTYGHSYVLGLTASDAHAHSFTALSCILCPLPCHALHLCKFLPPKCMLYYIRYAFEIVVAPMIMHYTLQLV